MSETTENSEIHPIFFFRNTREHDSRILFFPSSQQILGTVLTGSKACGEIGKWRCAHTGIGLAVAVGPGGRCTVPGLHLQRVRSLLLAIEHHLREDLSGLPIDLEVILPFVPVAVHHVISDLKQDDTPFRTIIINLFPFLLITRCHLQHINKWFFPLVSTKFFIRVHTRFLGLQTKLSGGRMVKIVRVIRFIKIEKSLIWFVTGGRTWGEYTRTCSTCEIV